MINFTAQVIHFTELENLFIDLTSNKFFYCTMRYFFIHKILFQIQLQWNTLVTKLQFWYHCGLDVQLVLYAVNPQIELWSKFN